MIEAETVGWALFGITCISNALWRALKWRR